VPLGQSLYVSSSQLSSNHRHPKNLKTGVSFLFAQKCLSRESGGSEAGHPNVTWISCVVVFLVMPLYVTIEALTRRTVADEANQA
jgi:hypothetical protein